MKEREEQHHQWLKVIKKIFKAMSAMEAQRPPDQPKFSMAIFPLLKFLKSRYDFKTGKPVPRQMRQHDRSVTDDAGPGSISDYYDQFSLRKLPHQQARQQTADEQSNYSLDPGVEVSGTGGGTGGVLRANTSYEGANLSFNDQISFTSFLDSANLLNEQQVLSATNKKGKGARKDAGDQFSFEEQDNEESETDGRKEKRREAQKSPDGDAKHHERKVLEGEDQNERQQAKQEGVDEKEMTIAKERGHPEVDDIQQAENMETEIKVIATNRQTDNDEKQQIELSRNQEMGQPPDRKTQTPSALGSTQIQNSVQKKSPPTVHKVQTQGLPESGGNDECLERADQSKLKVKSMESQPKVDGATAGSAQGLPFSPIVFLEHGGGSISSSTLQPVESKRAVSQLGNRKPNSPPQIVAPVAGHTLVPQNQQQTPSDYIQQKLDAPLPLRSGVMNSNATIPSILASSLQPAGTDQTEQANSDAQKAIYKQENESSLLKHNPAQSSAQGSQDEPNFSIERAETMLVRDEKAVLKEDEGPNKGRLQQPSKETDSIADRKRRIEDRRSSLVDSEKPNIDESINPILSPAPLCSDSNRQVDEEVIDEDMQNCSGGDDNIAPSFESQRASKDFTDVNKSRIGERNKQSSALNPAPNILEPNSDEKVVSLVSTIEDAIGDFDANANEYQPDQIASEESPSRGNIPENQAGVPINSSIPATIDEDLSTFDRRKERGDSPGNQNVLVDNACQSTAGQFSSQLLVATFDKIDTSENQGKDAGNAQYMFEVSDRVNDQRPKATGVDWATSLNPKEKGLNAGSGKRSITSEGQSAVYHTQAQRRANRAAASQQQSGKRDRSAGIHQQAPNHKHLKLHPVSKMKVQYGRLGQEAIKGLPYNNPSPYTEIFYASMKAATNETTSSPVPSAIVQATNESETAVQEPSAAASIADASKRKWGGRRAANTTAGDQKRPALLRATQSVFKENRSKSGEVGRRKKEEVIAVSGPAIGQARKFVRQRPDHNNHQKHTLSENEDASKQRKADEYELKKQMLQRKFQTIQAGETGGDVKSLRSHKSAHTVTFDGVYTVQQQQAMERLQAGRASTHKPNQARPYQPINQQFETDGPVIQGNIPLINDAATLTNTYIHKGHAQQQQIKGAREVNNNFQPGPTESRESLEPSGHHPYVLTSQHEGSDEHAAASANLSQHSTKILQQPLTGFPSQKPAAAKSQSSLLKPPKQIKEKIYSYQQRRLSQNQFSVHRTSSTQQAIYRAAIAQNGLEAQEFYQRGKVNAVFRTMQRTQNVYRVPPVESAWTRRFAQGSKGVRDDAKFSRAKIFTGRAKGVPNQEELATISGLAAAADIPLGYLVNFTTMPGQMERGAMLPSTVGKAIPASNINKDLTVDDLIEEYDAISYAKLLDEQQQANQQSLRQMGTRSGGVDSAQIEQHDPQEDRNSKDMLGMIDKRVLKYSNARPKSRDQAQSRHASLRNLLPQELAFRYQQRGTMQQ